MPSHKSAEKRVRVTAKRTAVNKARRSQIRSAIRDVEEALASGDKKAATAALKAAEPANHARGVQGRYPQEYRKP